MAQIRHRLGHIVAGNKTRTPIFHRNDQAPTPTQKKPRARYIYTTPQKILAKL